MDTLPTLRLKAHGNLSRLQRVAATELGHLPDDIESVNLIGCKRALIALAPERHTREVH